MRARPKKYVERLSLYPLTPEEALRHAMSMPVPGKAGHNGFLNNRKSKKRKPRTRK